MMARRSLLLVLIVPLAACGAPPPSNQGEDAETATTASGRAPQQEPFPWTGRFAASRELCSDGVWDIRIDRIETQGETSCEVQRIERSSERVTLHNACIAEGMESEERWIITRGGGDGIAVERDMGPDIYTVDLIRCH